MERKRVTKLVLVFAALVVLLGAWGCDMTSAEMQVSDLESRSSSASSSGSSTKTGAPVAFTATVDLYQPDPLGVVTQNMGNSNHHKTLEETLWSYEYYTYGGAIVSDWDLLDGKHVVMNNVTNYNLDPDTGEISGSNHSVINVIDETGAVVLTLQANGVLAGSILGADIAMNWVAKDAAGAKINAKGKIDGTFKWAVFNPETMAVEYSILPNGTFLMTGTYR